MHILLINTNPVVSRLVRLCIKGDKALLDEVSSLDNVKSESYDIVFIDDMMYGEVSHEDLRNIDRSKLILFSAQKDVQVPSFIDDVIKKPFLPSKVIDVIESLDQTYSNTPALSAEKDKENSNQILDTGEIEKIKSLLETSENEKIEINEPLWENDSELEKLKREVIKQNLIDEGLEIIEEDVISVIEPELDIHITHDKVDPSRYAFEQELLEAIKEMKVKKLKKLLHHAKITIDIHFNKDGDE